jgi:hypothetical protein
MRARFALPAAAVCLAVTVALGGCGGSSSSGASGTSGSGGTTAKKSAKAEVQQFLDELDAAVREGNTEVRLARLNPAVIQRYGADQCRSFLDGQRDESRRNKVKRVGKPRNYAYATDNLSATVPDTLPVFVRATINKKKGDRNLNLARVDGQLTYFIDCGTPLPQP